MSCLCLGNSPRLKESWKSFYLRRQLPTPESKTWIQQRQQNNSTHTNTQHRLMCVCVCIQIENTLEVALTRDSDIILSLYVHCVTCSPFCLCTIHLFWKLTAFIPVVLAASLSISVSYNDFSLMFMCPIITTAHLSLLHSPSHFPWTIYSQPVIQNEASWSYSLSFLGMNWWGDFVAAIFILKYYSTQCEQG